MLFAVNKKVAEKLAIECSSICVEKNWSPDFMVTSECLPRICELTNVSSVRDWLEAKYALAKASTSGTSGDRRKSLRQCQLPVPRIAFTQLPVDSTSSDSDTSDDDTDDEPRSSQASGTRKGRKKVVQEDIPDDVDCDQAVLDEDSNQAACTKPKNPVTRKRNNLKQLCEEDFDCESADLPSTSQQASQKKKKSKSAVARQTNSDDEEELPSPEPQSQKRQLPPKPPNRESLLTQSTTAKPKSVGYRKPRNLIVPEVDEEDVCSSPALKSSITRQESVPAMSSNDMIMQMMMDSIRQLRNDNEELKRELRSHTKRLNGLQVAVGQLTSSGNRSAFASNATINTPLAESTSPEEEDIPGFSASAKRPKQKQSTLEECSATQSNAVGSLRWIRANYGLDAGKEIVLGLKKLGIPSTKWASIFEGRFLGDKLMAVRLLRARFSEDQLANFCMSRPSQSKSTDAQSQELSALKLKKNILPDKNLMLGTLNVYLSILLV